MNERGNYIGREVNMGKKRKGIIRRLTPEQDVEKGIKKLSFYTVEVEMPWGIEEREVPEVVLRDDERKTPD